MGKPRLLMCFWQTFIFLQVYAVDASDIAVQVLFQMFSLSSNLGINYCSGSSRL